MRNGVLMNQLVDITQEQAEEDFGDSYAESDDQLCRAIGCWSARATRMIGTSIPSCIR